MFRDAPGDGDKVIEFTDDKIETHTVLLDFVDLAIDSRLSHVTEMLQEAWYGDRTKISEDILDSYINLIAFMLKYDCAPTLRAFGAQMALLQSHDKLSAIDGYGLGAFAGDENLCAASLFCADLRPKNRVAPRLLPVRYWKLAQPMYLHALACACPDDDASVDPLQFHYARTEWERQEWAKRKA